MPQHTVKRRWQQPSTTPTPPRQKRTISRRTWLGIAALVLITCGLGGFVGALGGLMLVQSSSSVSYEVIYTNTSLYAVQPIGPEAALSPLSLVFTPQVQYWADLIKAWAIMYQIDPNLIATVIQIESCGDPWAVSSAQAQGLFQVMPFHFSAEEKQNNLMLDVQTNASRGLTYLRETLLVYDGHFGLALAAYNGGIGGVSNGWATWQPETRQYYRWGTRIYSEAISGLESSPTLAEWQQQDIANRGGEAYSLCAQASESQRLLEEEQARSLQETAHP